MMQEGGLVNCIEGAAKSIANGPLLRNGSS